MFSLICTRINGWVSNGEAGDVRRNRAHFDVTLMRIYSYFEGQWYWDYRRQCEKSLMKVLQYPRDHSETDSGFRSCWHWTPDRAWRFANCAKTFLFMDIISRSVKSVRTMHIIAISWIKPRVQNDNIASGFILEKYAFWVLIGFDLFSVRRFISIEPSCLARKRICQLSG